MFLKFSVSRPTFRVPSSAFNVPRSALWVRIHVPLCVPRYGFVFRFWIPGSVFCVLRFGFWILNFEFYITFSIVEILFSQIYQLKCMIVCLKRICCYSIFS